MINNNYTKCPICGKYRCLIFNRIRSNFSMSCDDCLSYQQRNLGFIFCHYKRYDNRLRVKRRFGLMCSCSQEKLRNTIELLYEENYKLQLKLSMSVDMNMELLKQKMEITPNELSRFAELL